MNSIKQEATDSAIIHNLQFTFRHKFFNSCEISGRAREEEYVKNLMKRSKRGNGITKLDCDQ